MAAPNLSTNLGLAQLPEVDEFKYPSIYKSLVRVHNAIGTLQYYLDLYAGALTYESSQISQLSALDTTRLAKITKVYAKATVALSYGKIVNLHNSAGVLAAREANATAVGIPARGICVSTSAVAIGALAEIVLLGAVGGFSGLTPGQLFYTSTTAGALTTTSPIIPDMIQPFGYALDATTVFVNPLIM